MFDRIDSELSESILEQVLFFRSGCGRHEKPEDVQALLDLFPRVAVRDGYVLDYVQDTTVEGVVLPIRPFARPEDESSWIPVFDASEIPQRRDLVDEFYQYLEFEQSPEGLFEYAFFVIEMWSIRANRHTVEWLDSTPIFTKTRFDEMVDRSEKVTALNLPDCYGPLTEVDNNVGGRVRFLVHTSYGWERIYYMESMVFSDSFVEQEAGEIVADMGSGEIF